MVPVGNHVFLPSNAVVQLRLDIEGQADLRRFAATDGEQSLRGASVD